MPAQPESIGSGHGSPGCARMSLLACAADEYRQRTRHDRGGSGRSPYAAAARQYLRASRQASVRAGISCDPLGTDARAHADDMNSQIAVTSTKKALRGKLAC